MSVPGGSSFRAPVAALPPDWESQSEASSGVFTDIARPTVERTYCMIAWPFDPDNYNLLLWTDDPTNAAWVKDDVTEATGVTDPEGGTLAWSATCDNVDAADHIEQTVIATNSQNLAYRLWLQCITEATAVERSIDIVCYDETGADRQTLGSMRVISGPGAAATSSEVARINSLLNDEWTQVEIVWSEAVVEGQSYTIELYPGREAANAVGMRFYRPQVQHVRPAGPKDLVTTDVRLTEDVNGPNGAEGQAVVVRMSNNGYSSKANDSPPHVNFRWGLADPYSASQAIFSGGRLSGSSIPGFGNIGIANPSGEWDHLSGYHWGNRDLEVWTGLWDEEFDVDFVKLYDGSSEELLPEAVTIDLALRDSSNKVNRDVQERLYGGHGACLRGAGATEIAQGDNIGTGWILDDVTAECRTRIYAEPANTAVTLLVWGADGATENDNFCYRLWLDVTNRALNFDWEYGAGTTKTTGRATPNQSFPADWWTDGAWHHWGATRDATLSKVLLYIDGTRYLVDEGYSGSVVPTGGVNGFLTIGSMPDGTTQEADFDVDEVRVWDIVRSDDDINSARNTTVDRNSTGLRVYHKLDEGVDTTTYEETVNLALNWQRRDVFQFDGVDDDIQITDHADLGPHAAHTMEMWIYPGVFNSGNIEYMRKASAFRLFHRSSDDLLRGAIWDTTAGAWWNFSVSGTGNEGEYLAGDAWLHAAWVWDDATQTLRSFINGQLVRTTAAGGTMTAGDGGSSATRFASTSTVNYQCWIAEFRYFDTAVADNVIEKWYRRELDSSHPYWTDLMDWRKFDADPMTNYGNGGAGNGTVTGATLVSHDLTVDATASWAGSGEGLGDLAGKTVPVFVGRGKHLPLEPVDPVNLVYQPAEGPLEEIEAVYEGGVRLQGGTMGAETNVWDVNFEAASIAKAWRYDGIFTDLTTDINDSASHDGDVTIFTSTIADDDAFYVGMAAEFAGIDLWMYQPLSNEYATSFAWEYYNGTAWVDLDQGLDDASLAAVRDYSEGFKRDVTYVKGTGIKLASLGSSADRTAVRWTIPPDWVRTTVSDATSRYYVRARVVLSAGATQNIKISAAWVVLTDYVVDLDKGLVRLASPPFLPLTADVKGHRGAVIVHQAVSAAILDDNGVYSDDTTDANDADANDVPLLPATPVVDQDSFIIGSSGTFVSVLIDLTTAQGTSIDPVQIEWQYFTSESTWVALPAQEDGTNDYRTLGRSRVAWTMPPLSGGNSWVQTTINGQGPFFYIRGHYVDGTTMTTQPLAAQIWIEEDENWSADAATCVRYLATEYGEMDEATELDLDAFNDVQAEAPQEVGVYAGTSPRNLMEVMTEAMQSIHGSWVLTRAGQLSVLRLSDPSARTAEFTITEDDFPELSIRRPPTPPPPHDIIVTHSPYFRPLSEAEIAISIVNETTRRDLGKATREATHPKKVNKDIRHLDSQPWTFPTFLYDADDGEALAKELMTIYGVRREFWEFPVLYGEHDFDLDTPLELAWNRYNLVDQDGLGRMLVVVEFDESASQRIATIVGWG
jgi:hypothetical protein